MAGLEGFVGVGVLNEIALAFAYLLIAKLFAAIFYGIIFWLVIFV